MTLVWQYLLIWKNLFFFSTGREIRRVVFQLPFGNNERLFCEV
jgi:hypothetical protein